MEKMNGILALRTRLLHSILFIMILPVLQVLDTTQTAEPAIHHNGHPGAQRFTFLHTKSEQNTG